jgi:hypothetical protein
MADFIHFCLSGFVIRIGRRIPFAWMIILLFLKLGTCSSPRISNLMLSVFAVAALGESSG